MDITPDQIIQLLCEVIAETDGTGQSAEDVRNWAESELMMRDKVSE